MNHLLGLALLVGSVSAFATNGSHFIGVSPASTALGGTGVANYTNPIDALHKNPSLLGDASAGKGKVNAQISTLLIKNNVTSSAGLARESSAPIKFSPSFGASYVVDDKLSFGLGLLSFGGATVDQLGALELNQLRTRLSLVKLMPAVAYQFSDTVAVSVAPTLYYSALSVNHSFPVSSPVGVQSTRAPHATTGFGVQIGAAVRPIKGLTLGLTYGSEANITYKEIMNLDAFGPLAASPALAGLDDIAAQQPAEIAFGAGYEVTPDFSVTADYRFVQYATAGAFRELGWQNQHVIGLGAQYKLNALKLRAGFNYGKSPIRDATGEVGLTPVNFQGHSVFQQSLSTLNLVAFPAITETHATVGAGYEVSKELQVDLAVALALKKTITRSGAGIDPNTGAPGAYTLSAEASQFSVGLGATYQL